MPKKPESSAETPEVPVEDVPVEAVAPLVAFFYPGINHGTAIFATSQQEADEKAQKLLLAIASHALPSGDMALDHIGRLAEVGFGKESPSGCAVAVVKWIPKAGGTY